MMMESVKRSDLLRVIFSITLAIAWAAVIIAFASAGSDLRGNYAEPPFTSVDTSHSNATTSLRSNTISHTYEIGGQRLAYSGDISIVDETRVYWDQQPSKTDVILAFDSNEAHMQIVPEAADEVRLIVQLQDVPLAVRRAQGITREAARNYTDSLVAAQDTVMGSLAAQGIPARLKRRFTYVYNGLAITTRDGDKEAIAKTPGVRAVYPDYQVHASLKESVPLVGAPTVWAMRDSSNRPVIGTGVRVAIIDTGIDYNHTDLGGEGFPNTRVITGYNFIADNFDPWDDQGHGTFVAGVVGANGGVVGMAPDASLMAYKIFDAQAYGIDSDIIAAIERSLNPDGNLATDDGAQVLNLSLGDVGHPDDPLSQACDNAVLAGAVVVVAAGNSGPFYYSADSPGLARRVISVGATTKGDSLWTYSSRGPVRGSWAIKPDMVAPGVAITSTIPGNSYYSGDGTSAAAPHVAGAAALLLQLHPDWSPEWIQAALMNTALDLGRSPYQQGAGRLRVDKAATTSALILPTSLSLGRVEDTQAVWTRQQSITFQSVSSEVTTYTLSWTGSFPAGVTTTLSASQVVLPPGASKDVMMTLHVEVAKVPDKSNDPYAYWGALRADPSEASLPSLRVPFAFVKAPMLRLTVSELPASVMFISNNPLTSRYASPVTLTSDYLLPTETYSVGVQYQASTSSSTQAFSQPYAYVIGNADLSSSGYVELNLPRSAATHQARIAFTDESGNEGTPNHALHRFMWGGNGWIVSELAGTAPISEITRFSDVPSTFTWERTVADANPLSSAYRQWHGRAVGISADLEFLTTPSDFARIDHPLRALTSANAYAFQETIGFQRPTYGVMIGPEVPTITLPYERPAYYRTPPADHELYVSRLAMPSPVNSFLEGVLATPWLQLDSEGRLGWRLPFSAEQFYWKVNSGGSEPMGLGPLHWFARFDNPSPTAIRMVPAIGANMFFRAYQGGDVSWELHQAFELHNAAGDLVGSGDIGPYTGGSTITIGLGASGAYSMTLPFTYTLGTQTAQGRIIASFNTTLADPNPPYFKVLRILEADQPVDVASEAVELRMVITDATGTAPTVSVAYDVGSGWQSVGATRSGEVYTSYLPIFPDGTSVHLRIIATDAAGNKLIQYLEPAYLVSWHRLYLPTIYKGK
jgi:subtilisin family serine protease